MMREILFIADDLGISESANEAIFHAHRHGALDGAALMLGQPATEAAVAQAREHPSLQVGWHLHLVDSRPCTLSRWPWGDSPAAAGFALGLSARMRRLARQEIQHQWAAFQETRLPCRFVNAHHHLHVHPFVRRTLLEIVPSDFTGWIRWGRPCFFGRSRVFYRALHHLLQRPHRERWPFRASSTLWGIDRTCAMHAREIAGVLPSLGPGLHEFLFHPRRIEADADTDCLLKLRRQRAESQ